MAIRGPDPHNLRNASKKTAPVIEVDRECLSCGYNLRGLRLGINCPECGMPSVMPEGIDDPLSIMPTRVIVAFIRGCWVASLCVGALIAVVMGNRMELWAWEYSIIALASLSLLWVGAVVWLTPAFSIPQAVSRGFTRQSRLRRAARQLQWGWVLAAGCGLLITLLPNPMVGTVGLLSFGRVIGFMVGLAGAVVLCILLERLAEWARDHDAERMFNWSTWGIPIATPLLFIEMPSLPTTTFALRIIALVIWLIVAVTFPWGLLSLSKSVTLSILHSIEHRERMRRRDERTRRYHQHVADTVQNMDLPQE